MEPHLRAKGANFYSIGLSYKKADVTIRGSFSISDEAKKNILKQAKQEGIESLLIMSTCNRTELHGFAQHPFQLIKLLCEHTHGTVEEFEKVAYIFKNSKAVSHLFKVGTGLDSQILGDFEIISQVKQGFKMAKKHQMINPFMERLVNAVIQASKRIKNETEISSGATSVSFASVQYILKNVEAVSDKNILLFGTGKIGRNTCENLIKHTKNENITLINRTKTKAEKIAGKFNLIVKEYANIQARQSQVPNAELIIDEVITEFNSWLETRKFAPTIKALKQKLTTLRDSEIDQHRKKNTDFCSNDAEVISNKVIQKITAQIAHHLRESQHSSTESIELIQKVFQLQNL